MRAGAFRFVISLFSGGRPGDERRKKLSRLEQNLGYYFKDHRLLETALSHLSYVNETGRKDTESNERLEFLGDAVLDLLVSEYLYEQFLAAREGDLTRIKASIVSRAALAGRAAELGIESFIIFSRDSLPDFRRGRKTVISNCLEALIGAIYLDGGLSAARQFVYRKLLDNGKSELSFDSFQEAKNRLLHLSQVNYHCQPSYRIVEVSGPEHARQFVCEVTVRGEFLGRGTGNNKKEAEKRAAVQALAQLDKLQPTED